MDNDLATASNTIPGVVAFTGHMIDKVGRVAPLYVPRFPKEKEEAVTQAIRDALDRLKAQIGFCSAACGGDIIFIEQMLAREAEVHVVLPYGEDLFISDCIKVPASDRPGDQYQENTGKEWLPRFQAIKQQIQAKGFTWITLGDKRPQDNAMASDCCNRVFLGLGLLKAASLSTPLTLVALWDGWSGDAPGGTRSMVKLADSLKVQIEPLSVLRPVKVEDVLNTVTPPPGLNAQPRRSSISLEPPQQICAVLFADVMRFSDLDETKIPAFVTGYLNPLAMKIQAARHGGYGPLDFNTWGDGLFCVFDSMLKAGSFALRMQELVVSGTWRLRQSAEKLKLRIALHAGPVYRVPDPIFPKDTFFGTNVNFAARMEPETPPGEIYCSLAFAALAATEGVQTFACEYVGQFTLLQVAGSHPLYVLKPSLGAG